MRTAEQAFGTKVAVEFHGAVWTHAQVSSHVPIRKGLKDSVRKELRQTVIEKFKTLLERGTKLGIEIPASIRDFDFSTTPRK